MGIENIEVLQKVSAGGDEITQTPAEMLEKTFQKAKERGITDFVFVGLVVEDKEGPQEARGMATGNLTAGASSLQALKDISNHYFLDTAKDMALNHAERL